MADGEARYTTTGKVCPAQFAHICQDGECWKLGEKPCKRWNAGERPKVPCPHCGQMPGVTATFATNIAPEVLQHDTELEQRWPNAETPGPK